MDLVADARLAAAVSEAGGLGLLGGGYGEQQWLSRELDRLAEGRARREA
jgi:nitronate monooxygenase